jgi:hypothetical protein
VKPYFKVALFLFAVVSASLAQSGPPLSSSAGARPPKLTSHSDVPLYFEANHGQTDPSVRFLSHGNGYSVFLTAGGMVLALHTANERYSQSNSQLLNRSAVFSQGGLSQLRSARPLSNLSSAMTTKMIRVELVGSAQNPVIVGEDPLPTKVNYFIGSDPHNWRRNVPTYSRIRYRNVYPGIDLEYYGNNHKVEYDFDLSAGADPAKIQFSVKGAESLKIDDAGSLVLSIGSSKLFFNMPTIYQEIRGTRSPVTGTYVLLDSTHVGFSVGSHDPNRPLVIDPVLVYSTLVGGSVNDYANGIAVDSSGDAYVIGLTDSPDFPVATLGQYSSTQFRMFVTKFDPSGSVLLFADYFGGTSGNDEASAIALDSSGDPYVTGSTLSSDFPVFNAYQSSLAGSEDAFLVKFSADGSSIVYSTYLGGSNLTYIGGSTTQLAKAIAVDSVGEAIIVGTTMATDFPTTMNAYQSTVSPDQSGDWGEYGFITKFAGSGTSLVYSSYFAGNTVLGTPGFPQSEILGVATDPIGNAYVTGLTNTTNLPVTSGAFMTAYPGQPAAQIGFVSKFDPAGTLSYSTYLGGSSGNLLYAIAADSTGSAYVTGLEYAENGFPIISTNICDPSQAVCNGVVIAKLDPTGSNLIYSTYLGTSNSMAGQAIQIDASGDAFIVGSDIAFDLANPIEQDPIVINSTDGTSSLGEDVVIAEIDPSASTLLFATFLGGAEGSFGAAPSGLALDNHGAIYVTGETDSPDFPVTETAFQTVLTGQMNTFVTKIDPVTVAPAVAMAPFSLQFASQTVGTTSPPLTTSLRNMGSQALSLTGKTVSGDFAESDNCGTSVPPASSCTFSITFTPTQSGSRDGALTIVDDAQGSPHSVALSGTGAASPPTMAVSPASLTFAPSPVGSQSSTQAVTITNNGMNPEVITSPRVTGDFMLASSNCGQIAPSASCSVKVAFTPTSSGALTGVLQVTLSAGTEQTVPLNGTGIDFITSAAGSESAVVQPGDVAQYKLSVSPTGGAFSNAISITCDGLPTFATCTVSPRVITLGSTASLVTVSVFTDPSWARSDSSNTPRSLAASWLFVPFGIVGVIACATAGRRNFRSVGILMLMTAIMLFVGCIGTSHGPGANPPHSASSLPGSYRFNVVATSGTLQHITEFTLVVK